MPDCTKVKFALRCLGALVSVLFVFQHLYHGLHPSYFQDFFQFCHWFAESILGLFLGTVSIYMEIKGSFASVSTRFCSHMYNRTVLAIFYFWLGLYAMDGVSGDSWTALGRVNGFLAWIVAAGDLMVACVSDHSVEEELPRKETAEARPTPHVPPDVVPDPNSYGRGVLGDVGVNSIVSNPFESGEVSSEGMQTPPHGWNSLA